MNNSWDFNGFNDEEEDFHSGFDWDIDEDEDFKRDMASEYRRYLQHRAEVLERYS